MDSADTWSNPELFWLDEQCRPTVVAGCPPDAFTLNCFNGEPVISLGHDGKRRISMVDEEFAHIIETFDAIRIDHFRGFESYYEVPYGEDTARNGKWVKRVLGKLLLQR